MLVLLALNALTNMNVENFLTETEHNLNNTICLDFDGVIHNDEKGFYDGTIYGEPIEGSLESIRSLSSRYKVVIYSCKSNPKRPLVDGKTGTELIWQWLEKYNIKDYISDVTFNKPHAIAYIDDKAIRFENWNQVNNFLGNL